MNPLTINTETCKACGLCVAVCPAQLMKKADTAGISFRADRLPFCIKCGQCMAICPSQSIIVNGLTYEHNFSPLPDKAGTETSFLELIKTRRAIRVFKDQPVPRDLLEKIVEAITFAPPSFMPLKTEVVVVQDPAVIRRALPEMIKLYETLVKAVDHPIARLFVRREVGAKKYQLLKSHVAPLMKNRLPELKQGTEDTITRGAPAMILFHADRRTENYETDISIALTYGFLAAHALGLGATVIDLIPPTIEKNPALRELFAIPDENVVTAAMILGYPQYRYQRYIKRQLKSVIWI